MDIRRCILKYNKSFLATHQNNCVSRGGCNNCGHFMLESIIKEKNARNFIKVKK